jgi:hypothetical protein
MSKIIQTPQQRANTLEALNVMWPSVPPANVYKALLDWRGGTEPTFEPPTCGSVACFGGWCEWWPPFRKQLRLEPNHGGMGWREGRALFHDIGTGFEIFDVRGGHPADFEFKGTDHELVTHRLQWLLDNSEVKP